jgi:MFS family permease
MIEHGIRHNRQQFGLQLLMVFLVGLTIGMTRTVVPGLAQTEFGLGGQQFFLLASFVVVFGLVKAIMNLFAGKLSEHYGRKQVLLWGWLIALPIPVILYTASSWSYIVLATVLLGFNQGLTWSMALNSKLDLAHSHQKGLVNGFNEFAGYAAVGLAGIATAYLAEMFGAKIALAYFSAIVIVSGLILTQFFVKETLPWAYKHQQNAAPTASNTPASSLLDLFKYASLQHAPLVALNQAGLVEKFTDALVWVFLPVFFLSQNLTLIEASSIIAIYGVVWGASQLITGPLSDKIGRKGLIVWGMWLCGIGVLSIPLTHAVWLWSIESAVIGLGMAMLYPNLGAAVGDVTQPAQRASIMGIYRFWRDLGYAIGALLMGLLAQWSQDMLMPFWLVGITMLLSGAWVKIVFQDIKKQ